MRGNIGQLMKQAQAMQENMQKMQDQLAQLEVKGIVRLSQQFLRYQRVARRQYQPARRLEQQPGQKMQLFIHSHEIAQPLQGIGHS